MSDDDDKTGAENDRVSRPRGRPRVAEPLERLTTRLPLSLYERMTQLAKQHGQTVSQFARALLTSRRS